VKRDLAGKARYPIAFLGPGALSIDARLFGRKRLDILSSRELSPTLSKKVSGLISAERAGNSIRGCPDDGVSSILQLKNSQGFTDLGEVVRAEGREGVGG
jgi:hypothetical protein